MAWRRFRAPQVIAYWLTSASMARRAASFTSRGAGKSGNPCERFTAPCSWASRVISRMTDSVKRAALSDARTLTSAGPRERRARPLERARRRRPAPPPARPSRRRAASCRRSAAGKKSLTVTRRAPAPAGSSSRASRRSSGAVSSPGTVRVSSRDQRGAASTTTASRTRSPRPVSRFARLGRQFTFTETAPSGLRARPARLAPRGAHALSLLVLEPRDAAHHRRRVLGLVAVGGEQLLLLAVADEGDLDKHRRHARAHQDAERRLLHAAPLAARDLRQLLLDPRRQRGRLLEVLRLRHVPEDERHVRSRRRARAHGNGTALLRRHAPALVVAGLIGQEVDLASPG